MHVEVGQSMSAFDLFQSYLKKGDRPTSVISTIVKVPAVCCHQTFCGS